MILFPPAKINLGLNIIGKRSDGFHELETCMLAIPFYDIIEILPSKTFSFRQKGLTIPSNEENNLCVKAFKLFQETHHVPNVQIILNKFIPMGAGLGGGSSDATYVLRGLNKLFKVGCSDEELRNLSAQLGSDCPFFVKDNPQIARGRGELLKDVNVNLGGYYIKIVNPGIHVSTKEAFAGVSPMKSKISIEEIVQGALETWKRNLVNDFETSVFNVHPEIKTVKEKFYSEGAVYASMSGSGSTIFGIFKEKPDLSFNYRTNYLELIRKLNT